MTTTTTTTYDAIERAREIVDALRDAIAAAEEGDPDRVYAMRGWYEEVGQVIDDLYEQAERIADGEE